MLAPHKTGRTLGKHLDRELATEGRRVVVRRGDGTGDGHLYQRGAVGGTDDTAQAQFVDSLSVDQEVGQRTHRCGTAGLQGGEQGTLGGHGDPGERVVELGERGGEVALVAAHSIASAP